MKSATSVPFTKATKGKPISADRKKFHYDPRKVTFPNNGSKHRPNFGQGQDFGFISACKTGDNVCIQVFLPTLGPTAKP